MQVIKLDMEYLGNWDDRDETGYKQQQKYTRLLKLKCIIVPFKEIGKV